MFQEDLEEREWFIQHPAALVSDFFQILVVRRACISRQAGISKPTNSFAFACIIVWLKNH